MLDLKAEEKQQLLEADPLLKKLELVHSLLTREVSVLELKGKIESQAQQEMTDAQKQYYLRQQMKAIQEELGEGEGNEIKELRDAHRAGRTCRRTCKMVADRELDRLARMGPASPEYQMIRTYLDWILELPWETVTEDRTRSDRGPARPRRGSLRSRQGQGAHRRVPGRPQAERRHEGADPLLRRPARRRQDVARPVDRARDAAQVRAHLARRRPRRSGDSRPSPHLHRLDAGPHRPGAASRPARPIRCSCSTSSTRSPSAIRAIPAAALLEVLDPAQNNSLPRSLPRSAVRSVEGALHRHGQSDRPGASGAARSHGDRVALRLHRGGKGQHRATLSDSAPADRARSARRRGDDLPTTRCGSSSASTRARPACAISSGRSAPSRGRSRRASRPARRRIDSTVEADELESYLGPARFKREVAFRTSRPGVATGVAWTETGGDVLFIEASLLPGGRGQFILTGQLGDVMQESARAAVSHIRANARGARRRRRTSSRTTICTCTCPPARFRRTARRRA